MFENFEMKCDSLASRVDVFLKRLDEEDPALTIVKEHLEEFREHLNNELVKVRFEFNKQQADQDEDRSFLRDEVRILESKIEPI